MWKPSSDGRSKPRSPIGAPAISATTCQIPGGPRANWACVRRPRGERASPHSRDGCRRREVPRSPYLRRSRERQRPCRDSEGATESQDEVRLRLVRVSSHGVCAGGFVADPVRRRHPVHVFMTADAVGGVWHYALDLAEGLERHGVAIALAVLGPAPTPGQRAAAARSGVTLLDTG